MRHRSALLLLLAAGCSNEVLVHRATGAPDDSCHEAAWTSGVDCSRVIAASDDASLAQALAAAAAGDCIDLEAGSYLGARLPAGVSLLGRGAGCVRVTGEALSVAGQGESTLRGVRLEGVGVVVNDRGARARIQDVQIADAVDDGVSVGPGAAVDLERTAIARAGHFGIDSEGGDVRLVSVRIDDSQGAGLFVSCDAETLDCACKRSPEVTIEHTQLTGNATVAVYVSESQLSMRAVEVRDTEPSANFQWGTGAVFGPCTIGNVDGLTIANSADVGLLVANAAVSVRNLEVRNSLRGVVVDSDAEHTLRLEDAVLDGNLGQSLVAYADSQLDVTGAQIRNTVSQAMPVIVGGVSATLVEVGEGLMWCHGASVRLSDVSLEGSGRVPLLIDGGVGPNSRMDRITLMGQDAEVGIVWQDDLSGSLPELGDAVPPIATLPADTYKVACDEGIPPL